MSFIREVGGWLAEVFTRELRSAFGRVNLLLSVLYVGVVVWVDSRMVAEIERAKLTMNFHPAYGDMLRWLEQKERLRLIYVLGFVVILFTCIFLLWLNGSGSTSRQTGGDGDV